MRAKLKRDFGKLTKDQVRKALRRLNNGWPDDVWIFVGDGTLCLMERDEDGNKVFTPLGPSGNGGVVDQTYILESFPKIDVD